MPKKAKMNQESMRELRVQLLFRNSPPDIQKRMIERTPAKPSIKEEKEALKALLFAQGFDVTKHPGFWGWSKEKVWAKAMEIVGKKGDAEPAPDTPKIKGNVFDETSRQINRGETPTATPADPKETAKTKKVIPDSPKVVDVPVEAPGSKQTGKRNPKGVSDAGKPATARKSKGKRVRRIRRRRVYRNPAMTPATPKKKSPTDDFQKGLELIQESLKTGKVKTTNLKYRDVYETGLLIINESFNMVERGEV